MDKNQRSVFKLVVLGVLVLGLAVSVSAQGRGRGGGGGRGSGGGSGNAGGRPAGVGVDRGIGNASIRSDGRSDKGLGNASTKSGGRSDAGLERARLRDADKELREHPGVAHALHVNANDLRSGYQAALVNNPDLKFGQYVSATRLSQNLGSRHPNITRTAILDGLASGRSLGQTLQDLGLSDNEADQAKKRAEREIKDARRN